MQIQIINCFMSPVLWAGHLSQSNTFLNQFILSAIWQIRITNKWGKKLKLMLQHRHIYDSVSYYKSNRSRDPAASTGSFHPAANEKTGTRETEIWHQWLESNRRCCKGHAAMWSTLLAFGSKLSGQISTQHVKRFKMGWIKSGFYDLGFCIFWFLFRSWSQSADDLRVFHFQI